MLEGSGGHQAVHEREFATGTLVLGVEMAPSDHHGCVHAKEAISGPTFDALIPALDFVTSVALIHQVDALEHFAQREHADAEFSIVVGQPWQDGGIRPGLRGLAEDVGVYELGHGKLTEMKVARRGQVPFKLPVFDRAIAEDVHELFGWLEACMRFSRDDNSNRLPMPSDGLCSVLDDSVEQFTEVVFCVLKWPDCIHDLNVT